MIGKNNSLATYMDSYHDCKTYFIFKNSICGNSAYILGSTVELEDGLKRFLIVFSNVEISKTIDVIQILCYLLKHSDTECVLNAAGTLGTIVCRSRVRKSVTYLVE